MGVIYDFYCTNKTCGYSKELASGGRMPKLEDYMEFERLVKNIYKSILIKILAERAGVRAPHFHFNHKGKIMVCPKCRDVMADNIPTGIIRHPDNDGPWGWNGVPYPSALKCPKCNVALEEVDYRNIEEQEFGCPKCGSVMRAILSMYFD